MRDFGCGYPHTAGQPVRVATALATPRYNKNTVTAAPLRRLDDEAVAITNDVGKRPHLTLILDDAVELRYCHAGLECKLLRQRFVINARKQTTRIKAHDEVGITLVQTQHAGQAQLS